MTEPAAMKRGVIEAPMLNTVTTNLEGQCELYTMEGGRLIRHTLKSMPARKVCAYCKFTGERFANGNIKQTFYHCDTCNVPLCRFQSRECFLVYHKLKFQGTSSQGFFFSYQPLYVYCPCRVRIQSCIISYQWFNLRKTMPGCFSVLHV